jgi:Golgi nucleoside diphosphatase
VTGTNGGKVRPGLSSFHDHPQDAGSYIAPLLVNSATMIPESYLSETELFIKGTAGIRLLPDDVQTKLWDTVFTDLTNTSISAVPLKYIRENFQTITGHQEAFYAVVASNYIAGRIDGNLG